MHDPLKYKKLLSLTSWLWFVLWIFGIGLILLGGLHFWSGDQFLLVRLRNYLMPWILMGLFAGIVISLLKNRHYLALLLIAPTLIIIIDYAPLFLPGHESSDVGFKLKVMSYNVWRENTNVPGISEVIRNQKPDLILLQEIHQDKLRTLVTDLEGLYPNEPFVTYEAWKLQAMISRFPLIKVNAGNGKGRAQKAVMLTPKGALTVLNVHSAKGNWQRSHKQMTSLIADDIAGDSNPLILGGDFNTTDQSQTYRLFGPILENAHWQAGWGFGFTYPTSEIKFLGTFRLPPLVRIDHIFHSKHFISQKAYTLPDSGGSDHFPVVAELILKRGRPDLNN